MNYFKKWLTISLFLGAVLPALLLVFLMNGGKSTGMIAAIIAVATGAWLSALGAALKANMENLSNGDLPRQTTADNNSAEDKLTFASHQLRSPASALQSVIATLMDEEIGDNPAARQKLLAQAKKRCEDLLSLIEDILALAETQKPSSESSPDYCPITALSEIIERLAPHAEEKSIDIKTHIEDVPPPAISKENLEHIISNLLDNAIKYSPNEKKIEIFMEKDGHNLRIEVRDEGIGIPENELENICAPFHRTENAKKFKKNGSGLGLSIVKNIVEKAGGTVRFSSKLEKGTSAVVLLPLK